MTNKEIKCGVYHALAQDWPDIIQILDSLGLNSTLILYSRADGLVLFARGWNSTTKYVATYAILAETPNVIDAAYKRLGPTIERGRKIAGVLDMLSMPIDWAQIPIEIPSAHEIAVLLQED